VNLPNPIDKLLLLLTRPHLQRLHAGLLCLLAAACGQAAGAAPPGLLWADAGTVAAAPVAGAGVQTSPMAGDARGPTPAAGPEEAGPPLPETPAALQAALLELAFDAVSAMPVMPHLKNRSRAQEAVVQACIEAGQFDRARDFLERIENWRRGTAAADLAQARAERGELEAAEALLTLAEQVAATTEDESDEEQAAQGWRRERIRAGIAQVQLTLGREEQAAQLEAGLSDAERGALEAWRAGRLAEDAIDAQLDTFDALVGKASFEQLQNSLHAAAALYDRCYDDTERRERLVGQMEALWARLPTLVRVEVLMQLADAALAHDDAAQALVLLERARQVVLDSHWEPRDQIPMAARLAVLVHRAGDDVRARAQLDAARAAYDAARESMVDIDRAGALLPVAAGYQQLGDAEQALALYARAVEEGVQNPNARPRAEDLSAACCSLAVHGVQPDQPLWKRLHEIRKALRAPW